MDLDEFSAFIEANLHDYTEDLVRVSGMTREAATAKALRDTKGVREQGPAGDDNRVFAVEDAEEAVVGGLWLGTFDRWRSAWLFELRIDADQQRRGYGRAALNAAEGVARELGATSLKLHAFGGNEAALALYRSCGFIETDINMRKSLA